jgi:hypothetical protein
MKALNLGRVGAGILTRASERGTLDRIRFGKLGGGRPPARKDSQPCPLGLQWLSRFLNVRLEFSPALLGEQRTPGEGRTPAGPGAVSAGEGALELCSPACSCLPGKCPSVLLDFVPLRLHPGEELREDELQTDTRSSHPAPQPACQPQPQCPLRPAARSHAPRPIETAD